MADYDYLIVGGGMAADAAVRGLREVDGCGTAALLSAEVVPPYDRPPLSKGLWGSGRLEGIFRHLDYAQLRVDLHLTTQVTQLRPEAHEVVDAQGRAWGYGKLLLATGAEPRPLPPGVEGGSLALPYRGLGDYLALWQAVQEGARRFVILGGGFIGAELAASLVGQQQVEAVSLVFPEPALWSSRLPRGLADHLTAQYRERGVSVLAGDRPKAILAGQDGHLTVVTEGGRQLEADRVVAGLGVVPRDQLARHAGVAVNDGVVVDATGATSAPDVFACGDVARFPMPVLGGLVRVEHEDHAKTHGRQVGRNLAGLREPYRHLPMFYSDLFEMGFEAVGRLEADLLLVEDWIEPHRQGVVYYLEGSGRLAGVLLWNVWDRVEAARQLLAEARPWPQPRELLGRLRP